MAVLFSNRSLKVMTFITIAGRVPPRSCHWQVLRGTFRARPTERNYQPSLNESFIECLSMQMSGVNNYLYGASASIQYCNSCSHLSPFSNNFSLLYNNSSLVSVLYSTLGDSTMASTGHDSWQ